MSEINSQKPSVLINLDQVIEINNLLFECRLKIENLIGYPVKLLLSEQIKDKKKSISEIIEIVANIYLVKKEDIISESVERPYPECRCMIMRLIKETYPKMTQAQIGKIFQRDHSTVYYNNKTFDNFFETEEQFREKYNNSVKAIKE